jgi:hypothetical protein
MTAAIPPACCAGADDRDIHHTPLDRIGRTHRGDLAYADWDPGASVSGAKLWFGLHAIAYANLNLYTKPDTNLQF